MSEDGDTKSLDASSGLRLTTELEPYADAFLGLEAQASAPYTSFVFPDPVQATAARDLLFGKGISEFASPYGQVLLDGEQFVGMIACLAADELQRCRMRSAFALARSTFHRDDPNLNMRIRLAGETLANLQPDDFYLARIGIIATARGRGFARTLLAWFEDEARRRRRQRLVLEVHPANLAAYKLYQVSGFVELARHKVVEPQTGAMLEYIHMAKELI